MDISTFKLTLKTYLDTVEDIHTCNISMNEKSVFITSINNVNLTLNRNFLYLFDSLVQLDTKLKSNLINANVKITNCRQVVKDIIMLHSTMVEQYKNLNEDELINLLKQEELDKFSYQRGQM